MDHGSLHSDGLGQPKHFVGRCHWDSVLICMCQEQQQGQDGRIQALELQQGATCCWDTGLFAVVHSSGNGSTAWGFLCQ